MSLKENRFSLDYFVMGILNTTPDSFSDGGSYNNVPDAFSHAESMIQNNVDIIDIGGESTRPGAEKVPFEEELKRVIPLIKQIKENYPNTFMSIDTYKAEVAEKALEAGASMVNDIYGLRSKNMADVVAAYDAYVVIMHMNGSPETMQIDPQYEDVLQEVSIFFEKQIDFALKKGVSEDKIILDAGIGFGKTLEHNLLLIKNSSYFKKKFKLPVLVGASRKSMLGQILGNPVEQRKNASVITHSLAFSYGANIIRVHDVKESLESKYIFKAFENLSKN